MTETAADHLPSERRDAPPPGEAASALAPPPVPEREPSREAKLDAADLNRLGVEHLRAWERTGDLRELDRAQRFLRRADALLRCSTAVSVARAARASRTTAGQFTVSAADATAPTGPELLKPDHTKSLLALRRSFRGTR